MGPTYKGFKEFMSVPKSKRSKSKRDYDAVYFKVSDDIVDLVTYHFHATDEQYEKYKPYIDEKCEEVLRISDLILKCIRMANSIFPRNISEYWDRRRFMNYAIGLCFDLLTIYQKVMHKLHIPDDKYLHEIEDVGHLINSMKSWRKSDNHFEKELTSGQTLNASASNACNLNNNGNANNNGVTNANYAVGINATDTADKGTKENGNKESLTVPKG